MLKDQDVEAAGVGRRVFIKRLAATGALVGGLAVGGPASAQEAGGVRPGPAAARPLPLSWAGPASPASSSTTSPCSRASPTTWSPPTATASAAARPSATTTTSSPTSLIEGRGHQEGLLWVNHEYPDPFFIHGNANPETKTASQIELEQHAVGGSVIRAVRRGDGPGSTSGIARSSPRRITATSPRIKLTGAGVGDPGNPDVWAPVPGHTYGSLANCAGGITPWGTALSAEENWDDYAEDYGWGPEFAAVNNGGYGWVLEVDPMDPDWVPRKHTNLGRVRAENATVWARQGRHLVVYVGDDARDNSSTSTSRTAATASQDGTCRRGACGAHGRTALPRVAQGAGSASRTCLSVARVDQANTRRCGTGQQPQLDPATFQLNRPEDAEIDPFDNSLYTSLTNNADDPATYTSYWPRATRPPARTRASRCPR